MTFNPEERVSALRLIQLFDPNDLPLAHILPTENLRDVFSRTLVTEYEQFYDDTTDIAKFELAFGTDQEFAVQLPGLGGMEVVFGGPSAPAITAGAEYGPDSRSVTLGGSIRLRFPRDWLRPVTQVDNEWVADPSREFVELDFGGGITVDQDFEFTFEGTNEFTVEPAMIGDTGFVIEGTLAVDLSESSTIPASSGMGLNPTWRGVVFKSLDLHLPPDLNVPAAPSDLQLENFHIGGGGITGTIGGNWDSGLAGELFGMEFELQSIDVEFRDTALVGAAAGGTVTLPYFDGPVDLAVGITGDGTLTAALDEEGGIVSLDHDAYALDVDGLEFTSEGVPAVSLSGTLTPKLIPDAPGVRVDKLSIDVDGNVHVEGGWLSLPDQYSIDFYGFSFEITAFGIGRNDDGSKWLGLNGGIKFVDELGAGASVDGLRVTWFDDGPHAGDTPSVSFEGVGVELEIPDAVRFKGAVSYAETTLPNGDLDHRFEGDISLDLLALDLSVDGKLVVGTRTEATSTYTYCAVYLDAELPSGIPLFSTGLSLYGFSGLYAQNMAPALQADEAWFSRERGVDSWYHRNPTGATGFGGTPPKWPVEEGSFALGAGVTLGTASDNGYAFSGNLLLVIAFPGPVVMLNGEASLLTERSELDAGEPNFSALAVLDGRAGTFTFGLNAQYRYGDGGELVDIGTSVEAFYSLNDPSAWYVYIGRKEPREKRIRATVFSLFEANGYVMLDPRQLALGAWYGYDERLSVGPFGVDIEAWISGDAVVSFNPAHFSAELAAKGAVRLRAFGFSAGISLDASIAAEVFDPFHLLGHFRVALELPGFLPDPSATVTLEWGPEKQAPSLPEPLKEVAVGHDLSTTTWPLAVDDTTAPSDDLPVVPLDGRPELTFATAVHDDGYNVVDEEEGTPDPTGENANPVDPEFVRIGDPAANEGPVEVRYGLGEVRIERQTDSGWESLPDVYGAWAPVPTLPEGDRTEGGGPPMANTKLRLLSANPFEYVRHTGGTWGDTIDEFAGNYPCLANRDCWDFEGLTTADFTAQDATFYGVPVTDITRNGGSEWPVFKHVTNWSTDEPTIKDIYTEDGLQRTLTVGYAPPDDGQSAQALAVDLPEPRKSVKVAAVVDKHCDAILLFGTDDTGTQVSEMAVSPRGIQQLVLTSREGELDQVVIMTIHLDSFASSGLGDLSLLSICSSNWNLAEVGSFETARERTIRNQVARLGDTGAVFDPYATYRIAIETTTQARGLSDFDWYSEDRVTTQYAYFRTDGPPALVDLTVPSRSDPEEFDSGLEDLTRYIEGTIPETIPKRGESPVLPRPVYRAYDVGTRFTRNYVDRLYWVSGRDLALVLFDRNNEPVRTPAGRLHIGTNQWGTQSELLEDVAQRQWIRAIDHGDCVGVDEAVVARAKLVDATLGLGVLGADEVYEARLVPRLLRDTFGDLAYYDGSEPWSTKGTGSSADWTVEGHSELSGEQAEQSGEGFHLQMRDDAVSAGGEPKYVDADLSDIEAGVDVVRFAAAADTKVYHITAVDAAASTIEVDGTPSFTDSRWMIPGRGTVHQTASADSDESPNLWVRDSVQGAPGPRNWTDYVAATTVTLGAADSAAGLSVHYDPDTDDHLRYVIDGNDGERRLEEVTGSRVTVIQRKSDSAVSRGRPYDVSLEIVGTDLRVYEDDTAVFEHSLDAVDQGGVALLARGPARFGELRVDDVSTDAPIAYRFEFTTSQFANAAHHLGSYADETWATTTTSTIDPTSTVDLAVANTAPSPDEARAYETAVATLDRPTGDPPERVEATAVYEDDAVRALLLESPEPVDWTRTTVGVGYTADRRPTTMPPRGLKVTRASYGSDESVDVLLNESIDLTGHTVDYRQTGRGYEPALVDPAFEDEMTTTDLSEYRVPTDGRWERDSGQLRCIPEGNSTTLAVDGAYHEDAVWTVAFESRGSNTVGVDFRIVGDTGFRFVLGPAGRQLSEYDGTTETVLWSDDTVHSETEPFSLRVEPRDGMLWAFVDDTPVCAVADPGGPQGSFGPYVAGDDAVTVTEVSSHADAWRPTLFTEAFDDPGLDGWQAVDEPPETTRTSDWRVVDGTLEQHSNIYGFHGEPYGAPGTYLVTDETFSDGRITVRLRSDDNDAIGVMVRCRDDENYYRFSMDSERSYRRFDRQVDGITIPLWSDDVAFESGREYILTIDCQGDRFTGYLDGVELFSVEDDTIDHGAIALYCRANLAANFHDVECIARADQWVQYHAFADATEHPAGTQFHLHSGLIPTQTGAGIQSISAGSETRLPPTGAEFRIVGPDGVRHQRWIAPESQFTPVTNVTLSRSLDSTGVLLLTGDFIKSGTYRLAVQYNRDGDVTLRQNGDSSPEQMLLDVAVDETV